MEIGSEWRGWTVAENLGGGSFGKVYRIEREEFGYKYEAALKVIRIPHNEDEVNTVRHEGMTEESVDSYFYSVVKGISSELALLSQLSGNSNIVSYEDHSVVRLKDEFGWEIYLRMELATPLFEHLKNKKLTVRDVIQMGIDICRALETCENKSIIHRDIKPDNIFFSKQGTYKLGDFGIARKLDKSAAGMTKVGTFSYMAPEVYKGQPYDQTVDIYSLGIILYQFMNRNRRPFMPPYPDPVSMEQNEQANMNRLAGVDMPVPCSANKKLSEIILKACAYAPEDRYQNASDLRRDLESNIDDNANDVLFNEYAVNRTKSLSHAVGSSVDETVTMFGTEIDVSSDYQVDSESSTENSVKAIDQIENAESSSYATDERKSEKNVTTKDQCSVRESQQRQKKQELKPEDGLAINDSIRAPIETAEQKYDKEPNKKRKGNPLLYMSILVVIAAIVSGGVLFWYFNHTVPSVIGMSTGEAEKTIEDAGLRTGEIKKGEFSDKIKLGNIDSQSEKEGKKVKRGTVINLTTSKGEEKTVPGLIGISFKKAEKEAEKVGLSIQLDEKTPEKHSDKIDKGCVISQAIKEGTKVTEGTVIIVVRSKGPVMVKVPDLVGSSEAEAIKTVNEAGLKIAYNSSIYSSFPEGTVISQAPRKGEKIPKKGTVFITLSRGVQNRTISNRSSQNARKAKSKSSNGRNDSVRQKHSKAKK